MVKADEFMCECLIRHCNTVKEVCNKIYSGLYKKELLRAAEIHDIGKYYINDRILNSTKGLSITERMAIDNHAMLGYQDCVLNGENNIVCRLVLFHHGIEKVSIDLYKELMTPEIDILHRYLMAADIYSALREERCYHTKKSHLEAMEIINECKNIPEEVKLALSVLE